MVAADPRALVVLARSEGARHLPILYAVAVPADMIGISSTRPGARRALDTRQGRLHDVALRDDLEHHPVSALAGGWIVQWFGVEARSLRRGDLRRERDMPDRRAPAARLAQEIRGLARRPVMTELKRGLAHARALGIAPILWTKTYWGAAGGYLVLLSLAGRDRFGEVPSASGTSSEIGAAIGATAVATGALYSARGVGTGLGPLFANRISGGATPALRRQISAARSPRSATPASGSRRASLMACVFVAVAHVGGSALWIASTVLWQKHVEPPTADGSSRSSSWPWTSRSRSAVSSAERSTTRPDRSRSPRGSCRARAWRRDGLDLVLRGVRDWIRRQGLPRRRNSRWNRTTPDSGMVDSRPARASP
jgi:hypothetical protein